MHSGDPQSHGLSGQGLQNMGAATASLYYFEPVDSGWPLHPEGGRHLASVLSAPWLGQAAITQGQGSPYEAPVLAHRGSPRGPQSCREAPSLLRSLPSLPPP